MAALSVYLLNIAISSVKTFIFVNSNSYHLVSSLSGPGTLLLAFHIALFNSQSTNTNTIVSYFIAQRSYLET